MSTKLRLCEYNFKVSMKGNCWRKNIWENELNQIWMSWERKWASMPFINIQEQQIGSERERESEWGERNLPKYTYDLWIDEAHFMKIYFATAQVKNLIIYHRSFFCFVSLVNQSIRFSITWKFVTLLGNGDRCTDENRKKRYVCV